MSAAVSSPAPLKALPIGEWLPLDAVTPWDKNPRLNDAAVPRVAESIKRFGFVAPIVIWTSKRRMVAGHTRLKAMKLLLASDPTFVPLGAPASGLVPVRFHEFASAAEADLYALADNRLGEIAEWDETLLAEVLAPMAAEERLVAGFEEWRAPAEEPALEGDDVIPEPPKTPITKPGDVWTLDAHRLLCGDCRDPRDVERLLGGQSINVAFTSPPYASQRKYDEASGFKPIAPDEYVSWFEAVQANVRTNLAEDGSWFVNIKEHCDEGQRSLYVKDLTLAHVRQWRWCFIDELCWRNTLNGVPGGYTNRLKNAWEPIFHFASRLGVKFRPAHILHASEGAFAYSKSNGKSGSGSGIGLGDHTSGEGLARPSNVLEVAGETNRGEHTAPFPVALPTFFVNAFTDEGDAVFDPFTGSGTTIIACEKTGRRGFGVEISPGYCDVIVERWQRLTGKKATR